MERETFEKRIEAIPPGMEDAVASLVASYLKDVRDGHEGAIRIAQGTGDHARNALAVIGRLGETAVSTIGKTIAGQQPVPATWLLFELAAGVAAAESAVVGRLRAALSDARMIEPEIRGPIEEKPQPFRVRDDAYLGLRRILHEESLLQYSVESRHFLSLDDSAKDDEIENYLQTHQFTQFLDNVDDEE